MKVGREGWGWGGCGLQEGYALWLEVLVWEPVLGPAFQLEFGGPNCAKLGEIGRVRSACDMEAAGFKLEPFQQLNGLWSTLGLQGSREIQKHLLRELLDGFFFHEQQYIPHGVLYCT